VLRACQKGRSSVWASGSDPGFITETLPFALLSVQRRVDCIEIEEFGDLSHRPSPHMVMNQMRFGKPMDEFDPERRKTHLFGEYQPPLTVLATTIAGRLGESAPRRYPRRVVIAEPAAADRAGLAPTSPAKARIVGAAAGLFAEHGVGGTSLQMIASAIGVTKAAVYHQFKTKEEIVVAAAEAELARLESAMDAAEAEPDAERAREALLVRIVNLAVERRRVESTLTGDPVVVRFFAHYEPFQRVTDRLYRLLAGDDSGAEGRTRAAMLSAAIGGAVMHPLVADLDDDTLRSQLLQLAQRFLDVPG